MIPETIIAGVDALSNVANPIVSWNINQKNLAFQKWAVKKTMEREDNAVQRRSADMKAAGINPVLAAGSPASASPVHAPQLAELDVRQDNLAKAQMVQSMLQMKADISRTTAQNELLAQQAQGVKLDNEIKAYNFRKYGGLGVPTDTSPIVKSIAAGIEGAKRLMEKGEKLYKGPSLLKPIVQDIRNKLDEHKIVEKLHWRNQWPFNKILKR